MTDTSPMSPAVIQRLRESIELPDAGERFEVRALIGQGGMGRVYCVYDRLLQRDVALKALSLESETADLAARLSREARVLARLEHPGIAAIHDAGVLADGRPYYLMRLVRGQSLADPTALGARGERLRIFLRICDAVSFAHAKGVVHRDLKPGNIMAGEFGDVVVLDWGVAKLLTDARDARSLALDEGTLHSDRLHNAELSDEHTRDGVIVGTPGFMAPEQALGAARLVDVRADVFGLGKLLRHLLGDASPLPKPLDAIIAQSTAADPDARYQRVDELAADVRRWLDADTVLAYRESMWERLSRFVRRNQTLLLLLLAYALVRIFILWWRGV